MSKGLALHWRLIQPRYNLVGSSCINCGDKYFPPRNICPTCRRKSKMQPFKFSGQGEVFSYTVVRAAPSGFEYQVPYVVAVIRLVEGVFVTAQLVDCEIDQVGVGDKVDMVFRKIMADDDSGIIRYGYKFKQRD